MTHLTRSGVIQGFDQIVQEFGVDPEALLRSVDLDTALLDRDDYWIATRKIAELSARAAEACQCAHLGLLLAARTKTPWLGPIGAFLQTSTTVAEAIADYVSHNSIHAQGLDWGLQLHGEYAWLTVSFDLPGLSAFEFRQMSDHTLATAVQVIRQLSGGRCQPARVEFAYPAPAERGVYRRLLGMPVTFEAPANSVVIRAEDLNLPMEKSDREIHAALENFISSLELDARSELSAQVRTIIRRLLPTGQCRLDTVAACFACDKRTLQRHLEATGSSYRELLENTRLELAQQYLEDPRLSLAQIAEVTGYSDPANFTRAFRQHHGMTPSAWRKKHGVSRQPALVTKPQMS